MVLSCDIESAMELIPPKFDNVIISQWSPPQKIDPTIGECISFTLPSPPEDESMIHSILIVMYAQLQP